jgi:hypothetical protein
MAADDAARSACALARLGLGDERAFALLAAEAAPKAHLLSGRWVFWGQLAARQAGGVVAPGPWRLAARGLAAGAPPSLS